MDADARLSSSDTVTPFPYWLVTVDRHPPSVSAATLAACPRNGCHTVRPSASEPFSESRN